MVILGILSLLQLIFLPGAVVVRLFKFQGKLKGLLVAFGLSLLLNYQITFLLTSLGLFHRGILLALFFAEAGLLIFLNRDLLDLRIQALIDHLGTAAKNFSQEYFITGEPSRSELKNILLRILKGLAFLSALAFLLWYVWIYGQQYNMVFTKWDPVVSWDKWAIDWFNGRLPATTWHYPQVIPVSWALTYAYIGDATIKQFAYWFMGAFEVFVPLTLFILGWLKRNSGYFWGCTFAAWLVLRLGSQSTGYVDTAVACLSLIAIGCLLLALDETDARHKFYLLLFGMLTAAAAALTKQAGLWTVLIFPVLYWIDQRKSEATRLSSRQWWLMGSLVLLAVAPWYIYKQIQISLSLDQSEVSTVTSAAHFGRDYLERAGFGYAKLKERLEYSDSQLRALISITGVLLIVSLKIKRIRWITLLIVIPYVLLWTFLLSYDERNLTYALPFIGLASGFGVDWILQKTILYDWHHLGVLRDSLRGFARLLFSLRILYVAAALAILIALLPLRYSDAYLRQSAVDKQMEIGDKSLNTLLYAYYRENGFQGKILTDYMLLFGLPEIKEYYTLGYTRQPAFRQQLGLPGISYALYCTTMSHPDLPDYMQSKIDSGEYALLFQSGCWNFVSLCKETCQ